MTSLYAFTVATSPEINNSEKKEAKKLNVNVNTRRESYSSVQLDSLTWTTNPNQCALILFFKLNAPYFGSKEV